MDLTLNPIDSLQYLIEKVDDTRYPVSLNSWWKESCSNPHMIHLAENIPTGLSQRLKQRLREKCARRLFSVPPRVERRKPGHIMSITSIVGGNESPLEEITTNPEDIAEGPAGECYATPPNDKGEESVTFLPEALAKGEMPDLEWKQRKLVERPTRIKCDDINQDEGISKLSSDSGLPIPEAGPISPEFQKRLEKYNIIEPTLTTHQKSLLLEVLESHDECFSKTPYDLGLCSIYEHQIVTKGRLFPHPPRPMAYALRAPLREELDELLKLGVIQESRSAWTSQIVLVDKKDSTKRLCMDFRDLNAISEPCGYPLPRISDIFALLRGARYFSSLDISKGFWQIPIHPDSRHKTAFVTVLGQYEWTRVPMGLNSVTVHPEYSSV
jgi:hypothetical protein